MAPCRVQPVRNQVDLQPVLRLQPNANYLRVAYLYIPLHGRAHEEVTLGFGGCHHLHLWFNGKEIYQTELMETAYPPSVRDHRTTIRLVDGVNLLVIRLASGRNGAVFALGSPDETDCRSILDDPLLNDPGWSAPGLSAVSGEKPVAEIGSRRELFVDDFLIDALTGSATLRLHHPVPREVVAEFGDAGELWESSVGYLAHLFINGKQHMLYRACSASVSDHSPEQYTCLMESADGTHFTRPKLDLIPFGETKETNIIFEGPGGHNFFAFEDTHPGRATDERYKAVANHPTSMGLAAYASADGLRWRQLAKEPILPMEVFHSPFDSQNVAFYDAGRGRYFCYFRYRRPGDDQRRIKVAISTDFLTWKDEGEIEFTDTRAEHLYINGILPYPRAPHLFIGTPARFFPRRKKVPTHPVMGVSDTVLISSRDGKTFHRWAHAFLSPGPEPELWTDRNQYCAPGFLQLRPDELSIYWVEHNRHVRPRIRRGTLRTDGFASLHAADGAIGEMLTRPLRVEGDRLEINYATSAGGSIRFEICDETGRALPGYSLGESDTLYGNEITHYVGWRDGNPALPDLAGRTIRLRIRLQEADLYALRFIKGE